MISTTGIPIINTMERLGSLGLAIQGLKEIGKLIFSMAKVLGVLKKDIDMHDLGDKVVQAEAAGITPEKYESYAAYVEDLEKFEVDPEKSLIIPDEIKEIRGVEVAVCLMVEKFVEAPIVDFIQCVLEDPEYFENGKLEVLSEKIQADENFISKFIDYISGTEKNNGEICKIVEELIEVEKTIYPNLSDKEAYKNVMNLRK